MPLNRPWAARTAPNRAGEHTAGHAVAQPGLLEECGGPVFLQG
jgi:hypothetical protein